MSEQDVLSVLPMLERKLPVTVVNKLLAQKLVYKDGGVVFPTQLWMTLREGNVVPRGSH